MSEYKKEELVKRIGGMSEEEIKAVASCIKSDVLLSELKSRMINAEAKLSMIGMVLNAGNITRKVGKPVTVEEILRRNEDGETFNVNDGVVQENSAEE